MSDFEQRLRGAVNTAVGCNDNAKADMQPPITFNGPVTIVLGDYKPKKEIPKEPANAYLFGDDVPEYLKRRYKFLCNLPDHEYGK